MEEKLWNKILDKLPEESLRELDGLSEKEVNDAKIWDIVEKSGLDLDELVKEVKEA